MWKNYLYLWESKRLDLTTTTRRRNISLANLFFLNSSICSLMCLLLLHSTRFFLLSFAVFWLHYIFLSFRVFSLHLLERSCPLSRKIQLHPMFLHDIQTQQFWFKWLHLRTIILHNRLTLPIARLAFMIFRKPRLQTGDLAQIFLYPQWIHPCIWNVFQFSC